MHEQLVLGHERQQAMFARAVSRGRLGHAYLFAGPAGIGKRTFALQLAQALLCHRREPQTLIACQECPGCRQVLSGSHPDLIQVALPEGKSELPIEIFVGAPEKRGREGLCHELSLSPMHGGHRVAIIDDADKMNASSANALLKTLEEPGPGAVLILLAVASDQVIQTIRSRCQQVYFGTLSEEQIRSILTDVFEQEGVTLDPAALERAIEHAAGSVKQARLWYERSQQQADGEAALLGVLQRNSFRAAELAQAGETMLGQWGSDPQAQREGAQWILERCLAHFHQLLNRSAGGQVADELRDVWAEAMDLCFRAGQQIDRRASVPLCLDAFYQELEILFRPTWKNAAGRS